MNERIPLFWKYDVTMKIKCIIYAPVNRTKVWLLPLAFRLPNYIYYITSMIEHWRLILIKIK